VGVDVMPIYIAMNVIANVVQHVEFVIHVAQFVVIVNVDVMPIYIAMNVIANVAQLVEFVTHVMKEIVLLVSKVVNAQVEIV